MRSLATCTRVSVVALVAALEFSSLACEIEKAVTKYDEY